MTDDELRALVREAIGRHMAAGGVAPRPVLPQLAGAGPAPPLAAPGRGAFPGAQATGAAGWPGSPSPSPSSVVIASAPGGVALAVGPGATVQVHISHATFALPPASEGGADGPCTVDPHADCNHCGFCQSFGH